MTQQEVINHFGFTDRLAVAVVKARLDNIGKKTYTVRIGEQAYEIRKTGSDYSISEVTK